MMGGATEHDGAMAWFLARANGGDVLVLRASGSNGYNDYMYNTLGGVNSVETIVCHNANASTAPYVLDRIDRAEAIWFAGGDQWNYVGYWRGTPVAAHINQAITQRHIAIGGTSAGMAVLGGYYFSAQNGSVSSATALANPYNAAVAVDGTPFLEVPFLAGVITDTHYDNPDRRGRHTVFLARMATDAGLTARGIACNEYVAVTVDPQGIAHVWGDWPNYQEYAYFLQVNCQEPNAPEVCAPGQPLTWQRDGQAVKVYKVPGLMQGGNWFNLNDWKTGSGGSWEHWTAESGLFSAQQGTVVECGPVTAVAAGDAPALAWWDKERREAMLHGLPPGAVLRAFLPDGRRVPLETSPQPDGGQVVKFGNMPAGVVLLQAAWPAGHATWRGVF